MISKSRIGFFTPSIGLADHNACLEFVKARGGLIQAWTLPETVAHEVKCGLDPTAILSAVQNAQIRVSSLSGYMDWTLTPDNDLRRHEFKNIIRQCPAYGCRIVCTETGRNFTSRNDQQAWKQLVEAMRELCRAAAEHGVYVAVEMGRRDLIFGTAAFRRLQDMTQSKQLKINFDPANLVRGDIDPLQAARELKEDVVQVHLKDASPQGMCPLTRGIVDFRALTDILESNGYAGNYIIEAEYTSKDKAASVAQDYQNILNIITGDN